MAQRFCSAFRAIKRGVWAIGIAGLLILAPAQRGHAFLELLICEMDPLHDYCLARTLLELADTLPDGLTRDIAVVYAFAGWSLSTRAQTERDFRHPRASAFTDRIDNGQADRIVQSVNRIIHSDDTTQGLDLFEGVTHPVPRMIGYPLILEALRQADATAAATDIFDTYGGEIDALRAPPARIKSYGDAAWAAAASGQPDLAQSFVDQAFAVAADHPSEGFRRILTIDIAAVEYLITDGQAGLDRLQEAQAALDSEDALPLALRLDAMARIARVYGRIGMEADGRAMAQTVMAQVDDLEADDQVRVYAVLVFAQFRF